MRLTSILFATLLGFAFFTLTLPTTTASSNTIAVNRTADADDANPGDGICDSDLAATGDQCTLRAAVSEANASSGHDTITIPAGTYTLTEPGINDDNNATGDLDLASDITLVGAGIDQTIIQAGTSTNDGIDRVLQIVSGDFTISISQMTIRHGLIANTGTNSGQIDDGAGIFVIGSSSSVITIDHCKITQNMNDDLREDGGGIANMGGATVYLTNSEVSENTTRREEGSSGAGLFSVFGSHIIVHNSVISGNVAGGKGGGIYTNVGGASVQVSDSLIINNHADDIGGGIQSGTYMSITNSTVASNTTNLTGGGISNDSISSVLHMTNVTIADNTADLLDNNYTGGGLHLIDGQIFMTNTLIADNRRGTVATADDCDVDTGVYAHYSLVETMSNCTLTGTHNITNTDPFLYPLADYGGTYMSLMIDEVSPARDAGNNAACPTADQRGMTRPQNNLCDIGAIEYTPLSITFSTDNTTITATLDTSNYDCFEIWHSTTPYSGHTLSETLCLNSLNLNSGYYQIKGNNGDQPGEINTIGLFDFELEIGEE